MNAVTVIVILTTLGFSSALIQRCTTEADCGGDQCCLAGKICTPKLPVHSTCYLTSVHSCGCVSGSSCKVTFSYTIFGKTFNFRQCVKDDVEKVSEKRFLIRKCSTETVAEDCGKDRCCIGGKYCAPFIPKYVPCNLEDSHKCPCAAGLECKVTKSLKIPVFDVTLALKQCMPADEGVEVEEVEMTED